MEDNNDVESLRKELEALKLQKDAEVEALKLQKDEMEALKLQKDAEVEALKLQKDAEVETLRLRLAKFEESMIQDLPTPPNLRLPRLNFKVAESTRRHYNICSPSKDSGALLQDGLTVFNMDAAPHVDALKSLSQVTSLRRLRMTGAPSDLLSEKSLYELSTEWVPEWVTKTTRSVTGGSQSAKTMFGFTSNRPPPSLSNMTISWMCQPEFMTMSKSFFPPFNGELKSAMSSGEKQGQLKLFDELVTYVTLGMVASYFDGVPSGKRRFFTEPPLGYGLAAFPHVGYLVAVEWIGKLFVSIVSQPFFVGSPEHQAAIASLPKQNFEAKKQEISLEGVEVYTWPSGGEASVWWRCGAGGEGEDFFKLIACHAYNEAVFERMHVVYSALSKAWEDKIDPPPNSLVPAQLLFGAGEVCITMPWIEGRDATMADLDDGGCAVQAVASAIHWLAKHGLVYTDLRPPNVRIVQSSAVAEHRVVLVDYDDMHVCDKPLDSHKEFLREIRMTEAIWACEDVRGAMPAVLKALEQMW